MKETYAMERLSYIRGSFRVLREIFPLTCGDFFLLSQRDRVAEDKNKAHIQPETSFLLLEESCRRRLCLSLHPPPHSPLSLSLS